MFHWPGALSCNSKYLHSHGIRLQWIIWKLWQIFSKWNERHWLRDGKIDIDFVLAFLWFFRRFSINIRIEVHFFRLHAEMKGHWSRVNLWDLHQRFTRDQCPLISQCKPKSILQSLSVSLCRTLCISLRKFFIRMSFHISFKYTCKYSLHVSIDFRGTI